jgi:taurine dioxygenase
MDGLLDAGIDLRLPHPVTGAEVLGVDLHEPLTPLQRQALDRLLAERGVLVFRDQSLDPRGFARAIGNFGPLMPQQQGEPGLGDDPVLGYMSSADAGRGGGTPGDQAQTDLSNHEAPPRATALYGVNIPRQCGDMQFSHLQAAYAALPEAIRLRIEGATALHARHGAWPRLVAEPPEPAAVQPLVTRHPLTGRQGLYLNAALIQGIIGMPRHESAALLAMLLARTTDAAFTHRHRWRAGDVVIWDNRTVLHRSPGEVPEGEQRFLYRVMVKGGRLQ